MAQQDNPYAIPQQFTEAITPPQYQSTGPNTVSGFGTKKQEAASSIALLADKFLAGVSKGRAAKFQQQQQERSGMMQDINRRYQILAGEKDKLTDDAYKSALNDLQGLHVLAVKTALDKSEDKSNPMIKGLKNIFESMLGPKGKNFELGPEQIYKTLAKVDDTIRAPQSSRTGALEQVTEKMDAAAAPLFAQADAARQKDPNASGVTTQQLLNNKEWIESAGKLRGLGVDYTKTGAWLSALGEDKKQSGIAERKVSARPTTYDKNRQESIDEYVERNPDKFPNIKKDEDGHYDPSQLTALQRGEARSQQATRSSKMATTWIQRIGPDGKDTGEPELVKYFSNNSIPGVFDKEGNKLDPKLYKDAAKPTIKRLYGMMQQFTAHYEGMKDENGKALFTSKEAEEAAGSDLVKLALQQNDIKLQQAAIRGVRTGVWETEEGPIGKQAPPKENTPNPGQPVSTGQQTATPPLAPTPGILSKYSAPPPKAVTEGGSVPSAYSAGSPPPTPPLTMTPSAKSPAGLLEAGNIDLGKRPIVKNKDGSTSTVRSMSFEQDGKEILVPTVSEDGKIMTDDEAIAEYKKTGKNLGVFKTSEDATKYAKQLHDDYANGKIPGYKAVGQQATPESVKSAVPAVKPKPAPTGQAKSAGGSTGNPTAAVLAPKDRSNIQAFIDGDKTGAKGIQGRDLLMSGKLKDPDGNPIRPETVTERQTLRSDEAAARKKTVGLLDSTRAFDNSLKLHQGSLIAGRNALPSSDVKIINDWILSGAEQLPSGLQGAAAKYAIDLQEVKNEYSRIIGGGTQSTGQTAEGARADADKALARGFSAGTMKDALDEMAKLVDQKKQGWKQEVTRANRFLAQPVLPEMYGGVYHDNTYEEKDTTTPPQYGRNGNNPPPQELKERTDIPKDIADKIPDNKPFILAGPDGKQITVKKQNGKVYQVNP